MKRRRSTVGGAESAGEWEARGARRRRRREVGRRRWSEAAAVELVAMGAETWPRRGKAPVAAALPVAGRSQDDLVEALPGQPSEVGFRQFAGYVTVNESHGRALFYWFFEATHDVQNKPLVLWLNGGPGCSSVGYGAVEELGPLLIQKGEPEIRLNPNSWNKDANLLFLESPAGVGFSYTNTTEDLSNFGDALTAHDAHAFLVNWFKRFPQFKGHDFYVAGESYAGHYVPQLAEKILEENDKLKPAHKRDRINLKGIMIGNAAIDASSDDRGLAEYAWNHAVVSDEVYGAIKKECTFADDGEESQECNLAWNDFFAAMRDIDLYSLYTPACTDAVDNSTARRRFFKLAGTPLAKVHRGLPYNTYDPCADHHVIDYLNRADVQEALHANVTGIPYKWAPCSDALNNWADAPASTLPAIKKLVDAGLRVWVFSGDTDDRVPVTSTRYALQKLNLPTVKSWREWFTSDQVGGYTVVYDGLTFVTVRGAGHMVPMITPVQASQLFAHFLDGKELPATPVVLV
ncbi:serine carboxypeptidase-like 34 [Phragmites australis]|uniref:serine carboxypeptidase-like 34 n=1 Tax=Phragmites australis TaxID=29695 RepID=UPI002D7904CD|nr:serine carboxypeptidase-like 34 [Phragmites australis]